MGSLTVVWKNYVIILISSSDNFDNSDTFHTFNMDSHCLKQGKLQGTVPSRIADGGACLLKENVILAIEHKEFPSRNHGLYLLTIAEDPEKRTLEIKSELWNAEKKNEKVFKKIYALFVYKEKVYLFGECFCSREMLEVNLWQFDESKIFFG